MNMTTNHTDHLAQTIGLMHGPQNYPMLVLKNLDVSNGNVWTMCHYLAVNIAENDFVVYRFKAGEGKDNWLTSVKTVHAPFYQMLNDYAEKVLKSDGYTTLEVLPL